MHETCELRVATVSVRVSKMGYGNFSNETYTRKVERGIFHRPGSPPFYFFPLLVRPMYLYIFSTTVRVLLTSDSRSRSVAAQLPRAQLSNMPWRRADLKYLTNEAFFDVIEELDAILDRSGTVVTSEINGYVRSSNH